MRANCRVVPRRERSTLWRNALSCVSQSDRQEGNILLDDSACSFLLFEHILTRRKYRGDAFHRTGYDLTSRVVPRS